MPGLLSEYLAFVLPGCPAFRATACHVSLIPRAEIQPGAQTRMAKLRIPPLEHGNYLGLPCKCTINKLVEIVRQDREVGGESMHTHTSGAFEGEGLTVHRS